MDRLERYRGCLMGLAAGDALGTALEFKRPGTFAPMEDMVGGGAFNLLPGQWTDDTSMALCLAESLLECKGFDPLDQLERYHRWYRFGHLSSNGRCFDIGHTVRAAIEKYESTRDPARVIEMAGESSRTTHGARAAVYGELAGAWRSQVGQERRLRGLLRASDQALRDDLGRIGAGPARISLLS